MNGSNDNKKWLLPVGIGCGLLLICLCLGAAVGGFYLYQNQTFNDTLDIAVPTLDIDIEMPTMEVVIPTIEVEAPNMPAATEAPAATPTDSGPTLTGNQTITASYMFDDFSSDALMWPIFDDGVTILKYENDAYSFQITEPEYIDWAYVPVEFSPTYIKFDIWGPPGDQNGSVGVFCQYQDTSNHYYAEFDLQDRKYILATYINGEDISLNGDNFWVDTNSLQASPQSTNTIELTCTLDSMSLTINGEFVDQVTIPDPLTSPGTMAVFVYPYSYADENGTKVYFDNVEVQE